MKTKCRRIMSIFVVSLLVLTSVCTSFSVSAAVGDRITYKYVVDCNDEINTFEGEITFPSALSVDEDSIVLYDDDEGNFAVKNNKILFNGIRIGDEYQQEHFDFSGGVALITVDFIVNGDYNMSDIKTSLTEFFSTDEAAAGNNKPFGYENTVNDEVISSGYVDLDNPSDSHANPIVTFVDGDNVTTEIVEYNTAVSKPADPVKDGYDFLGWYLVNSEYNFSNPVTEDITLEAKWEVKNQFYKKNTVSFKDNLTLNFLATLKDDDVDGAYVVFSYNHYGEAATNTVYANSNDKNGIYYRFRCVLTASEMAINVTAKLYLKNSQEPIDTFTRSIRDYCIAGFANNNVSATEKALYRATLNYGGYTQDNFGYNTDLYAYEDYQDSMDNVTVTSAITNNIPKGQTSLGLKYIGASVFFRNAPYVRYYFDIEDGKNITDYTFTIDGETKVIGHNSNGYYIEADPALAYKLDDAQTVVVKKGAVEAFRFNYSVIKWTEATAVNQSNPKEQLASKAMYNYHLAAKAYVASNS